MAFRNLELLAYTKVPVEESRGAHYPDTGAAECPQRLISESVRAGKAGAKRVAGCRYNSRNVAVDCGFADQIRTNRATRVLQRSTRCPRNRDREAGVGAENAAQVPASQERVGDWMPVIAKSAAFAKRQFICARPDEIVRRVEERRAVIVAVTVVVVSRIGALRADARGAVITEVIGQRLAQVYESRNSKPFVGAGAR